MKANVFGLNAEKKGSAELPAQFSEHLRPDVIRKVFRAMELSARQSYGASPEAGKRASAELSRRRRDYRGSYGFGISRVPRKILSRRGTRMNWVGAFAPGTVGGRRAHPPKPEKVWAREINKKERRLAIRAAISASAVKDVVEARGHIVPEQFPLVLSDEFESISSTNQLMEVLAKLGLEKELARAAVKSIRAGKGKMRGRKYRKRTGPLLVVSRQCEVQKAARNIPGVSCAVVTNLNVRLLAPGGNHGRLTLFTESAIARLREEKLFTEEHKPKKEEKKAEKQEKKATPKAGEEPKKAVKAVKTPKKESSPKGGKNQE